MDRRLKTFIMCLTEYCPFCQLLLISIHSISMSFVCVYCLCPQIFCLYFYVLRYKSCIKLALLSITVCRFHSITHCFCDGNSRKNGRILFKIVLNKPCHHFNRHSLFPSVSPLPLFLTARCLIVPFLVIMNLIFRDSKVKYKTKCSARDRMTQMAMVAAQSKHGIQ